MRVEIINTGSELMLGRVLNTHQQWLCRQLSDLGYTVARQVAVPDSGPAIEAAVREALARADVVITTGGLGPTSDDITRDQIARLFGRKLLLDAQVLDHISRYFTDRKRPQPESTKIQAQVPEDAMVLMNRHGTAPGLILEAPPGPLHPGPSPALLVMLPGPPRELRPMFTEQALEHIQRLARNRLEAGGRSLEGAPACRTLKTTGIGESRVEEIIAPPLQPLVSRGLEIGYCARTGEVDLRFFARGPTAQEVVDNAVEITRSLLNKHIYGEGEDTLEGAVIKLLTDRKLTLATAESCTGGFIAHRLTNVPGASKVFWGGLVTYDNAAKCQLLAVDPDVLEKHGAVSEPVARQMATGARQKFSVDYAIAVTGIAGPSGGTPQKPVGTVFIAVAGPSGTVVMESRNLFDRETFKWVTAQQALEILRRRVLDQE